MSIDKSLFDLYTIEELQVPQDNTKVYMNRYWITYEGSVLRFKRTGAWQCNSLKELVDAVIKGNSTYEGCEIQYFDFLYIPQN